MNLVFDYFGDVVYEFSLEETGTYYVRFVNKFGYEIVAKGTATNANKINLSYVSDALNQTSTNTNIVTEGNIRMLGNINLGVRKKAATLTVHHYIDNTTIPVVPDVTKTVYYTDEYIEPYQ